MISDSLYSLLVTKIGAKRLRISQTFIGSMKSAHEDESIDTKHVSKSHAAKTVLTCLRFLANQLENLGI